MSQVPSTLAFFAILCHLSQVILAWQPSDFSGYPSCAQNIWLDLAPESCDYGDSTTAELEATNSCLCYDTEYLKAAAQAIWTSCGCSILLQSAGISEAGCIEFGGGTSLGADEFVAAGDGGQATCQDPGQTSTSPSSSPSSSSSSSSPSSSPSPSPSSSPAAHTSSGAASPSTTPLDNQSNNNNKNGSIGSLSAGTVAGITVASVVFTAIGAAAAVWACCCGPCRHRRQQ